jgi:chaperonin GroEL (HSP60 family)
VKGQKLESSFAQPKANVLPFMQALLAPCAQIAENAGTEGAVVVEKVRDSKWEVGYNAMSGEYEDLFEAGVIDPAKVTRCALQNAASVAGMVLTTQAIIVEKKADKSQMAGSPAMPGGLSM